ncbi:hypothetical protein [Actinomadura napierensis]
MAASSPIAACGSGYHVIDQHNLGSGATIYLMYNGSTNCVITWKKTYVGTPTSMAVSITKKNADREGYGENGDFSYYAGPVKIDAAGTCVSWGGSAEHYGSWYSGWSHCG